MNNLKTIPDLIKEIRPLLRCISLESALKELRSNNGVIIDVREPSEVLESPSPNSINIPRGIIEMKMTELYPNPEQAIYVHCATGARATLSAEQLKRLGYQNVNVITCDLETIRAMTI